MFKMVGVDLESLRPSPLLQSTSMQRARSEPPAEPTRTRSVRADLREMCGELVEYRELLTSIIVRDLAVRYKQTLLGFAWAVFVPLVSMLVFTVVFTHVAPVETDWPYPVYAYAGLLPWTFFASSLQATTNSLTGNIGLVTKVYFPREVFPIASVSVGLVDFLVASTVLGGLMIVYGITPSWTLLLVPVVVAVQVAFTLGLGFVLAIGNLFYRDVRYLVSVLVGIWMFATSVVYPVDRVDGALGSWLQLNPMTPIIDAYRSVILRGVVPAEPAFFLAAGISVVLFFSGWLLFHRTEQLVPERA